MGTSIALCCLHGSYIDLRQGSPWPVSTKGRRCSNDGQATLSTSESGLNPSSISLPLLEQWRDRLSKTLKVQCGSWWG